MNDKIPIIGITMGDPAGIGPEIIAKALTRQKIYEICKPVVIGYAEAIEKGITIARVNLDINKISDIAEAKFSFGLIDVLNLGNLNINRIKLGKTSAIAGDAAFKAIKKSIDLTVAGRINAVVTTPIHKESLNMAGHHFPGHTEIFAQFTNTKDYAMLLANKEGLRVIHVSTHVPIKQVSELVKKARIVKVIELLHNACLRFGIKAPQIGVAGLNPHASDSGLFGDEEKNEIIPAIQEAKKSGFMVQGPFPPDIIFPMAVGGQFDGIVAMYHDQGHIPFKLIGFHWDPKKNRMSSIKGVNITLGLPIIRVSVDHGTAFEIAGKGIANEDSLVLAIEYAAKMAD